MLRYCQHHEEQNRLQIMSRTYLNNQTSLLIVEFHSNQHIKFGEERLNFG